MNSCNRISRQGMQAICLLATLLRFSARPTEAAETSAALSPVMREALPGLSAEDYQTREQAQKQIQLALSQQLASLLANHDIEVETRTAALLEFNDGVTRWAIDTLKLPPEQRQAQIKWGLNPEVLPIVARIYSPTLNNRIEGIKQLPKYDDADVSFLLARLLNDSDRAVYLGAMEAVWDRKPTDAIVDALWYRAVENGFALPNSQPVGHGGNMVFFRGRPIGDNIAASRRLQDDQIAVEVLIKLKAAQMRDRLKTFFEKADQEFAGDNVSNLYLAVNAPMANAYRLAEAYKPKEIVPVLYRLAIGRGTNKVQSQLHDVRYYWTIHTAPLAALVTITEQNPEDYKLQKLEIVHGLWSVPTEADEAAAVEKIKNWWQKNAHTYGVQPALLSVGSTADVVPAVAATRSAAVPAGVRIQKNPN